MLMSASNCFRTQEINPFNTNKCYKISRNDRCSGGGEGILTRCDESPGTRSRLSTTEFLSKVSRIVHCHEHKSGMLPICGAQERIHVLSEEEVGWSKSFTRRVSTYFDRVT